MGQIFCYTALKVARRRHPFCLYKLMSTVEDPRVGPCVGPVATANAATLYLHLRGTLYGSSPDEMHTTTHLSI